MGLDVEINATCDECGGKVGQGDYMYCEGCTDELKSTIEQLEKEVEALREHVELCKSNCKTCEHRMECVVSANKVVKK